MSVISPLEEIDAQVGMRIVQLLHHGLEHTDELSLAPHLHRPR
jgi:hypothetical protein